MITFHKDLSAICVFVESFNAEDYSQEFLFNLTILLFCLGQCSAGIDCLNCKRVAPSPVLDALH